MSKWRIVQVKPDGLPQAYIIEEFVIVLTTKIINPIYKYHQYYYESQCRLSASARPKDWWVIVPTTEKWQDKGQCYYRNDLGSAKIVIKDIQLLDSLKEEEKTFKRKIIQEYD